MGYKGETLIEGRLTYVLRDRNNSPVVNVIKKERQLDLQMGVGEGAGEKLGFICFLADGKMSTFPELTFYTLLTMNIVKIMPTGKQKSGKQNIITITL